MENVKQVIEEIEDYLVPFLKLDAYEKALYYHLFRHSRLKGKEETIFVIGTALTKVGLSEGLARDRIRKLNEKGCIKIQELIPKGVRVSVILPTEINGCITIQESKESNIDIETIDFYNNTKYRLSILDRENGECFYCFRKLTKDNLILDHMISQLNTGKNSYRNIVASCHECNSTKIGNNGDDFVRILYRKGKINSNELENRLSTIEKLQNGELRPDIK